MTLTQQLRDYIHAGFAGLWIQTWEPDEAEREIERLCIDNQWHIRVWDCARGRHDTGEGAGEPISPLKAHSPVVNEQGEHTPHLVVLHNYHRFLNNPMVVQNVANLVMEGKADKRFVVILSHTSKMPEEIEKLFVVIEHQLPAHEELLHIAHEIAGVDGTEAKHWNIASAKAAAGLTRYEAEGSYALSLARYGTLRPDEVWELKESMLKKSGLLQMHRGKEKFKDLGGLEALKSFASKAIKHSNGVRAKGILLLGVPGTGKSAFAKALGNETGRPTLILDMGAMKASLVGQSEERIRKALKIADAMAPCVLFVDEIEKAIAGGANGYQGDGGVSSDQLGTLLTWLNDHESDVFFICTSNDISRLPPEFSRAERFDGIFFIDLPEGEEKARIWELYRRQFNHEPYVRPFEVLDAQWTGAEIKACCRLSALLNVSLPEAAKNIVPIATTAGAKVQALREWASNRCLDANTGGIYHHTKEQAKPKARRAINKD